MPNVTFPIVMEVFPSGECQLLHVRMTTEDEAQAYVTVNGQGPFDIGSYVAGDRWISLWLSNTNGIYSVQHTSMLTDGSPEL